MRSRGRWVLVLALAACGGDDATSSSSSDGTGGSDGGDGGDPGLPGAGWTKRREITLDEGVLGLGLVEFPVLVRLDSTRIDYGVTDAFNPDVRFYDGELGQELAFEVESWNPDGTSSFWVKLPAVEDTDAGRSFWMYYGHESPSAASQPSTAVWDDAYLGVWHMVEGAIGVVPDATANGHDASLSGGGVQLNTPGMLGPALRIDASASSLSVPDGPTLFPGQSFTLEGWVNPTRVDDDSLRSIVRKRDSYALRSIGDMTGNPGRPQGVASFETSGERVVSSDAPLADGAWTHLATTFDVASGDFSLWVDGAHDQTRAPPTGENVADSDFDLEMGLEAYGLVDEVRISTVARGASWLQVQHQSMTDALLSFGPEQEL